jgi:hypothetical protein
MDQTLPSIGRTTFTIHVIAAVCVGLPLLVAPLAFGAFFGYPGEPGLVPVLREMAYLAVQTLVFVLSAFAGSGPAMGNWLFAAVSAVLFALFAATYAARPK